MGAQLGASGNLADELEAAGYTPAQIDNLKALQKHYLNLREIIRKAAGETLDLKPYEADMRHLIDTYIEAQAPRKISPFDGIGLLDLIVTTGIADAIAERLGDMNGNKESIAETIENNVRSKILKEQLAERAIEHRFIQPGKPTQNAYIESFNSRFRDECLSQHWFASVSHMRSVIENWREDYNERRPHSSCGYLPPAKFAAQCRGHALGTANQATQHQRSDTIQPLDSNSSRC